ncbi:MAG TPA: transposase [Terracidiphilus sp.]|jgi:transposase
MRARGEASDWAVLEPAVAVSKRTNGRGSPPADTRAVLNGVLWNLCTEAQWQE